MGVLWHHNVLRSQLALTLKAIAILLCLGISCHLSAQNLGDDDTILVESSHGLLDTYNVAITTFSQRLLGFYVNEFIWGGESCTNAVIRNFTELSKRTNYGVGLRDERVELKLSVEF